MGVPAFFKWLTLRYPKIVIDAEDDNRNSLRNMNINLNYLPGNSNTQPSVDNLYLDMNGIIHPCCHPMDRPQPQSLDEMFNDIFEYVDKLISIIKPKKLIYLAIDGVAPRAKMNQQRSRRFRAALDSLMNKKNEEELKQLWNKKGFKEPIKEENKFHFDSNTITPGTEFMDLLSDALNLYISHRLQFDNLWKDRTVIFSNACVPGEGEHKILDFIRCQRSLIDYDPNISHCIYGADADLIMLSLITHEPNFIIIRESINDTTFRKCEVCGKTGHSRADCPKVTGNKNDIRGIKDIEFSIIKVNVLREYLMIEFNPLAPQLSFPFDFERLIDDFVLLCFFVGNDFLPHLPSLKIREGGLDALLFLYKHILPKLGGYITEKGKLNLERTEVIFKHLSLVEDEFFRLMNNESQVQLNRRKNKPKVKSLWDDFKNICSSEIIDISNEKQVVNKDEINLIEDEEFKEIGEIIGKVNSDFSNIKNNNRAYLKENIDNHITTIISEDPQSHFKEILQNKIRTEREVKELSYVDTIKLGESGWKERYYKAKFNVSLYDFEFLNLIKTNYVEGLCWVYEYYYNGCPSWNWFYAFHYAPFVSDLLSIKDINIQFTLGEPFKPIEQLLSVLPPASSHAIPKCLQKYMLDADSEIADFYPKTILLDINGQPFEWMGVNLIPFIEEDRIHKVVSENEDKFNENENKRNQLTNPRVYTSWVNKEKGYLLNFKGFKLIPDDFSVKNNEDLRITSSLKDLVIKIVKRCNISSFSMLSSEVFGMHSSSLKKGMKLPYRVVLEDTLSSQSKRNFKGDVAINLVKTALNINELDLNEVQHRAFDNYYNNNRAVEYNPYEKNILGKKRYQQSMEKTNNYYQNRNLNLQNSNSVPKPKERNENSENIKNDKSFDEMFKEWSKK